MIVNLDSLSPEQQRDCISDIEKNIQTLKVYLEDHLSAKEKLLGIPETGLAVLKQPLMLAEAIEAWIVSLKKKIEFTWNRRPFKFSILLFRALGTGPNKI